MKKRKRNLGNAIPASIKAEMAQPLLVRWSAKLFGAIALLVPGFPRVKEWAYAGFTFAWICAIVAHYLAGDGPKALVPLILLVILLVSYFTEPASHLRRSGIDVP